MAAAVERPEVFGFLGPNGAGKTTTINMLCTLARPTGGRAFVTGHDVVRERDGVRRNIGLVFQDPTLDGYLTATQNLRRHAPASGGRGDHDLHDDALLHGLDNPRCRVRLVGGARPHHDAGDDRGRPEMSAVAEVIRVSVPRRSWRSELRAIKIVWQRELVRFRSERLRIITSLVQPLLFLFVLGVGLNQLSRAGTHGVDLKTFIYPGILCIAVMFTAMFSAASIVSASSASCTSPTTRCCCSASSPYSCCSRSASPRSA
jgi:ABC-type Fe3+/spermidine/putrescine transport system ATPase subunit